MGFKIKNYHIIPEENFLEKNIHHFIDISFRGFNRFSSVNDLTNLTKKISLNEIRHHAPHLGLHEGCLNRIDVTEGFWNFSGSYTEEIPRIEIDLFLKAFTAEARHHYGESFSKGLIKFAGSAVMFILDTHVDAYKLVDSLLSYSDNAIKGTFSPENRNLFIKFNHALQLFTAQHVGKEVYQRAEKIRVL